MYIYIYKLAQHIRTISLDIYNVLQRNGTTPAGPLQKSKRLVRHWPRTSRSPLSHPSPPRILANLLPWLKSSNSRHHLYLYRCFVSGQANYIASPIRKTLDTVVNRIKRSFDMTSPNIIMNLVETCTPKVHWTFDSTTSTLNLMGHCIQQLGNFWFCGEAPWSKIFIEFQ